MNRNVTMRRRPIGFEALEGRALLSVGGLKPPQHAGAALPPGEIGPRLSFNEPGLNALLNGIFGGASEFVALARQESANLLKVAAAFADGRLTQYVLPGIAIHKQGRLQSGYTGLPHDVLVLHTGGAAVLKNKQIELAAIARGNFTAAPFSTTIEFAINRGAGQRLGPYYRTRPGITPDALVSVTVGPYGKNNSATITDLTTGTTHPISAPRIAVAGATARVLLDLSQLPSEGFPVKRYTFAAWAATQPNAPIEDVGSFVPEDIMIPVGIETNVSPTF